MNFGRSRNNYNFFLLSIWTLADKKAGKYHLTLSDMDNN